MFSAMLVLDVNGTERRVPAAEGETLLTLLRDRLGLTGTKYGCGEGQCGACTILLDGRAVRSCRTLASAAVGKRVVTIEGLSRDGGLHPVQRAFLEAEAFQCGYCTPGMILSAVALLDAHPHPDQDQIIAAMNGNLCRCGTYLRILQAIRQAAREGQRS